MLRMKTMRTMKTMKRRKPMKTMKKRTMTILTISPYVTPGTTTLTLLTNTRTSLLTPSTVTST